NEQATLHSSRPIGDSTHPYLLYRRVGRLVLQTQTKKLQQQFGILRWPRQRKRTLEHPGTLFDPNIFLRGIKRLFERRLQLEFKQNGANRKRARCNTDTELVEKSAQQEGERLQLFYRVVQLKKFFKCIGWFSENKRTIPFSTGDGMQANAFLPHTFGEGQHRRRRKRRTGCNSPIAKHLGERCTRRRQIQQQR